MKKMVDGRLNEKKINLKRKKKKNKFKMSKEKLLISQLKAALGTKKNMMREVLGLGSLPIGRKTQKLREPTLHLTLGSRV